ncbi:MAG TPA: hypothetical protein VN673_08925, partial [Clostridia bacterium]|nr:hypothetical protein [Clostridia bacterium]
KAAVEECVARECNGCWPEEHWFDIGESWSVNIYVYDGKKHIAVYPNYVNDDDYRETNCDVGIILQ